MPVYSKGILSAYYQCSSRVSYPFFVSYRASLDSAQICSLLPNWIGIHRFIC